MQSPEKRRSKPPPALGVWTARLPVTSCDRSGDQHLSCMPSRAPVFAPVHESVIASCPQRELQPESTQWRAEARLYRPAHAGGEGPRPEQAERMPRCAAGNLHVAGQSKTGKRFSLKSGCYVLVE